MKMGLFVAAGLLVSISAASAQPHAPGTPPSLERRVFVDVNGVTPGKVLDELADAIACTLDVDRALPQPEIALTLSNVRARTALDAVCDMVGCRWRLDGHVLHVAVTSPPPPVPAARQLAVALKTPLPGDAEWKLERVPVGVVLAKLSGQVGAGIALDAVDPALLVTDDLRGRTPADSLQRILETLGYNLTGGSSRFDHGRLKITFKATRR